MKRLWRKEEKIIATCGSARQRCHAREALAIWKNDYNTISHTALSNMPPAI